MAGSDISNSETIVRPSPEFCSQAGSNAIQPVWASAPEATVWLLIEHSGPWGSKAVAQSSLSIPVKQHIEAFLDKVPGSKCQLIRHPRPATTSGRNCFLALATESNFRLFSFFVQNEDDLLNLDFSEIARAPRHYADHALDEPLILVCTNGKRDKCCAKFGLPLYKSLAKRRGGQIWQTTHFGGHKFAPTFVSLPQGLCFGRVPLDKCDSLLDQLEHNIIDPLHFRGRCCYSKTAQAADYFLRRETGEYGLEAFQLLSEEKISEENKSAYWLVKLAESAKNHHYHIRLKRYQSARAELASCTKRKLGFPMLFQLEHIEKILVTAP